MPEIRIIAYGDSLTSDGSETFVQKWCGVRTTPDLDCEPRAVAGEKTAPGVERLLADLSADPASFDADFEVDFQVSLEPGAQEEKRFSFTLGNGSARLELESFDGSIHLTRRGHLEEE